MYYSNYYIYKYDVYNLIEMPESNYYFIRTRDNKIKSGGQGIVHKILGISDGVFVAVESAFGNNVEFLQSEYEA